MCIALVTTAHPKYALIVLDNRDEYVLRPTSRPKWWTHEPSGHMVLCSRDLQRAEHGTWMGITKQGRLAVLTNYREIEEDSGHPVHGVKSRGGMVTAWLGAPDDESLPQFIKKMTEGRLVKGVGGFSLICGDLKRKNDRKIEPLAIISNRSEGVNGVPWIGSERGKVWGLSNTVYEEPPTWPKVKLGSKLVNEAIQEAVAKGYGEDELTDALFSVLDTDTLPPHPGKSVLECIEILKDSIFIRPMSDEPQKRDMRVAVANGKMKAAFDEVEDHAGTPPPEPDCPHGFEKGAYGTQRQTIILVDWDGNVTYRERALWDAHGNPVERGKGDATFKFGIEGWE